VYNERLPKIVYHQGLKDTCISSSFASCLHHLGFPEDADWVQKFGSSCLDNKSIDSSRMVQKIVFEMHLQCKKFFRKWHFKKINPTTFDIWNQNETEKLRPKLLIPVGHDGGTGHAFSIYNGMIFDSNLKYAVDLNSLNLEFCIRSIYEGVVLGYEMLPKEEQSKARKRRRLKRRGLKKIYKCNDDDENDDT
jgi:hypothetical protein